MSNTLNFDITESPDKLKSIIDNKDQHSSVVFYSLEESLDWNNIFENVIPDNTYETSNDFCKIVIGDTCPFDEYKSKKLIKANPFLLKTVYRTQGDGKRNSKWNFNSNKALILTGKPHRENRIGFLVECVKAGILKNHIYSFFPPKDEYHLRNTIDIFNKVCDWDYDVFCKEYQNNPDDIDIRNNEEDMHYSGFPYSVDLFNDTIISVVLETNLSSPNGNNPDFSEKTYKSIINKHPFIILNQPNSLWFLKKYGFYTFEDYMEIKDYDLNTDLFERNRDAVRNLNYFLNNYHKNIDEINEKVEFNYNLMIKLHDDFKNENSDVYSALSEHFFRK